MSITRLCSVFLLVNVLTGIPKGCTETISKSVCLEESVQLFQNVSLTNRTIVVNQIFGDARRQIALWFSKDSIINSSIDKRLERILFLDTYGTIWMRNVRHSEEGRYSLVSTDNFNAGYLSEVELSVLVAPSLHCKPRIESEENKLIALLNITFCGRPAASAYWIGYSNQSVITVQAGKETGPYHACIHGPSLRCARGFKATDYCSSFRRGADEELQPKIFLEKSNIQDRSITLQCQANGKSAGMFRWRRNGITITKNVKYSQTDKYLTIWHLNNDDKYDIFTCLESGGQFQSYPYNIETSGPSVIQVIPNITMVKEMDTLNVSCLTDCYPLCSVTWSKLDPSSGHNNVFLENDALQLRNVARKMSGNYTCRVQNLITGTSMEGSLSLHIHYGPDKIVLNTSNNIIEVDEFDSVAILCTAECFPPCVITWTELNVNKQIGDAELKLINVSANHTYTCHAWNPSIDTRKLSQTINIAVKLDETLIPKIGVYRRNISDSSVVLKCHSFRKPKGRFSWMVNGYLVKHTDRYSPENDLLHVRYLTAEDEKNMYTCKEPGSKFHSDPYWIKTSGPTDIRFSPKDLMVKEHNGLNVSCLADCYHLCSFLWFKLDPYSGHKHLYSDEHVLHITDSRREMSGNYSCKVQNIITGAFKESSLSLDVLYGPDEVVVHTSENKTEVYRFSSTTVFCSADCFPPCMFRWTFSYTDTVIEGAILPLVNVTSNGSLTCHVTNPINVNATLSESIYIMEKTDDARHKTSPADKDQDGHITVIDIPSIRYVLYFIPVIGGIGAIIAVVTFLRKKNIPCTSIARVSNNTINAHSGVGESNQEETVSQHYWTIVTNIKGDFFTAVENDINVELRQVVDSAANTIPIYNMSEELEAYSYSFNSDPIEIETNSSDSTKSEGYINPIHSDPTKFNEYSDPRCSQPIECNAYIHPVPSDPLEHDYKGGIRSIDDPTSSHSGKHDEYTTSACLDAMERDKNIDNVETENVETDRHLDTIPSDLV